MMEKIRNAKEPKESAVRLAVLAVEESPQPNPLDQDMSAVDLAPTSLDLGSQEAEMRSNPRCTRPRQGVCSECSQPL